MTPCRPRTSAPPTTCVIIQGVSQFPTSIGFVGLAYAENAGDAVKIVAVDEGEGCVAASAETVADGTYALSRPLFIYPALNRLASNPAIAPFVDFYLSDEGMAKVAEVGYVAAAGRRDRSLARRVGRGLRHGR